LRENGCLCSAHVFESGKVGLLDSEIIPHYFGEILNEAEDVDEAVYELLCTLKGSNSVTMLHVDDENAFLHLVHKGKTRGLTVWANEKNEVIFCSRPEPVVEELKEVLVRGKFKEKASIKWLEDAALKPSFPIAFE
jgi:glucosamine 6-phosphate synthetase-like amidotransferase/phosphosugar isomerase protein